MARLTTAKKGFYLDTYAMVEYLAGNQAFRKYFEAQNLVTSVVNLAELYYFTLSRLGEGEAEQAYISFKGFEAGIRKEDISSGMKLRLRMRARRIDLSYADALGYAMSVRLGMKFLTGDSAFRTFSNVEFVM